jgi:hypothetical protein
MKSFVFFWFNEQIVGPIKRKKLKKNNTAAINKIEMWGILTSDIKKATSVTLTQVRIQLLFIFTSNIKKATSVTLTQVRIQLLLILP